MPLDYALILSAGLGSRMGEIGKHLPKVMWPIYSKTLIQLQIDYCKDLGINRIYINVHFLADEIIKHIESIATSESSIVILHEEQLLDSGGAIHNLAKRPEINYHGSLLLVNADQFLFFNNELFEKAARYIKEEGTRAVLFGIKVNKNMHYNETVIENDMLVEIRKNDGKLDYNTYSGLGIVNLDRLKPVDGISKFFTTVVDFKVEKTYMLVPESFEYWDFGTVDLYTKNIIKIVSDVEPASKKLLMEFFSKHEVAFNRNNKFLNTLSNSVDLEMKGRFEQDTIIFKNIRQTI
jgi:mannose-1-phosphate guanylyltransferase